jgi:hypothetical protein
VRLGIDVADGIFVDAAVAVVVVALLAELDPVAELAGLDRHQQARVLRIELVRALAERDLLAHGGDVTVAVHVVETVLVHLAIAVVVDGHHHGAREVGVGGALEPKRAAVGVDHGQDVEDRAVEHLRHPRQLAVILEQIAHGVERRLGSLHLVGVGVAVDVHGRLRQLGTGRRIGDGDHPEIPPLGALADALEAGPPRIGRGVVLEEIGDLLVSMQAVESGLRRGPLRLDGLCERRRDGH